jgi:hypothetical protein
MTVVRNPDDPDVLTNGSLLHLQQGLNVDSELDKLEQFSNKNCLYLYYLLIIFIIIIISYNG